MELSEEKKQILEAAIRLVLVELVNEDKDTIDSLEAIAHNISVGAFGHLDAKIPIHKEGLESCLRECLSDLTVKPLLTL